MAKREARLDRNPALYLAYVTAFNAHFWLPVFFLYFSERLTLERVLRLEAIYYLGVVLLEVPSGYFSDAVGRRLTLLVSSAALVLAHVLFLLGTTFAGLAAAQLMLAVAISFNSGTNTAFHYDALVAVGRPEEFAGREARAARNAFLATAVAAVLGGAVGMIDLRFAYALSALAAVATVGIVVGFAEPITMRRRPASGRGVVVQLRRCGAYLRRPSLRWLFGFAVIMTVLNHIPYEFYQPYLELLGRRRVIPADGTPLAAGVVTGLTMIVGGWVSARSIRVRDRWGLGATLLTSVALQTGIIALMGLVLHPLVVLAILLRSTPRALMTAPLNAAVTPQLRRRHRATYLSLQSVAGRLCFSATLMTLSLVAGRGTAIVWPRISPLLLLSAGLGVLGLLVLAANLTALRSRPPRPGVAGGP